MHDVKYEYLPMNNNILYPTIPLGSHPGACCRLILLGVLQELRSNGRTLWMRNVNFQNSGEYSCEVIAERTFLTLIKKAHMQVVGESVSNKLNNIKS